MQPPRLGVRRHSLAYGALSSLAGHPPWPAGPAFSSLAPSASPHSSHNGLNLSSHNHSAGTCESAATRKRRSTAPGDRLRVGCGSAADRLRIGCIAIPAHALRHHQPACASEASCVSLRSERARSSSSFCSAAARSVRCLGRSESRCLGGLTLITLNPQVDACGRHVPSSSTRHPDGLPTRWPRHHAHMAMPCARGAAVGGYVDGGVSGAAGWERHRSHDDVSFHFCRVSSSSSPSSCSVLHLIPRSVQ